MKFGIREICDVVLRAKTAQKIGNKIFFKNEPVCYFDTLKTSTFEGSATTVYATGGRGNTRLVSWDGEQAVTFTMEDALISPIGLSILTGAGLIDATEQKPIIVHTTERVEINKDTDSFSHGFPVFSLTEAPYDVNNEVSIYVLGLDNNGDPITEPYLYTPLISGSTTIVFKDFAGYTATEFLKSQDIKLLDCDAVLVDYYVERKSNALQIDITPDKFGGSFYLEASTLWRDQATGKDLPAEFIIPNCRVQSNFTFSMSSTGDPSTFTFTMDAFPDYTRWDKTKKVLATIQLMDIVTNVGQETTRLSTYANPDEYNINDNTANVSIIGRNDNLTPSDVTLQIADYTYDNSDETAIVDNITAQLKFKTNINAPAETVYQLLDVNDNEELHSMKLFTVHEGVNEDADITCTLVGNQYEVIITNVAFDRAHTTALKLEARTESEYGETKVINLGDTSYNTSLEEFRISDKAQTKPEDRKFKIRWYRQAPKYVKASTANLPYANQNTYYTKSNDTYTKVQTNVENDSADYYIKNYPCYCMLDLGGSRNDYITSNGSAAAWTSGIEGIAPYKWIKEMALVRMYNTPGTNSYPVWADYFHKKDTDLWEFLANQTVSTSGTCGITVTDVGHTAGVNNTTHSLVGHKELTQAQLQGQKIILYLVDQQDKVYTISFYPTNDVTEVAELSTTTAKADGLLYLATAAPTSVRNFSIPPYTSLGTGVDPAKEETLSQEEEEG